MFNVHSILFIIKCKLRVYITQLIRYSIAYYTYSDVIDRARLFTKLLSNIDSSGAPESVPAFSGVHAVLWFLVLCINLCLVFVGLYGL